MKGDPVIEGQVAESISTETINLLDSDSSNLLSVKWNEDDSLDRTLNLMLSGANRDLTLSGNVALNQSLLTTSSPTFNNLTLTNPTFAMFGLSAPVDSSIPQWDVVNSVWTWSTGIADLSGFTTDDLDEGTNNKYFPGFTSLSTDYSFTDNSSNWDTAYGWGDHADAGYLTTESDPVFTGWDKSTGISITESQISDFGSYAASGANSDITSLTGLTTALGPAYGGTGVANNAANTVTFTGNYSLGLTLSGNTSVTLPTSGTLLTTTGSAASLTNFPTFNQNTTGTAANLSGTPALPNGTSATTQSQGDNTTKLATTAYVDAAVSGVGGYTNLTSFVNQTPWRLFYSDGDGDVTELALGSDGSYLKSNGASAIPSWDTPTGGAHDAVSLSTELAANLLGLSTQQLTLDTQAPNTVFAGPATGVINGYPTFRALVASDIPALSYVDTETDPVFTAWDRSTGISITESQISDFGTYLTSLTGLTTDNLTEGSTNKYFPGFTSLSTDYSFTDNSSNWDTAYGWGDHASGGYVKADGTVNFTGKVSYNNDKTFTSDTELVSKKYVDDSIISAGGYTDEMAQDAVGAMADTNSLTYVDATPSLSVKLQMSLTSDASGIKLSGDAATPGNNKVYGTDANGTKGWYNAGAGSMTYPAAGIALSTGSAWGSSITDNSANWNTAYSWGNHASANYLTTAATGVTAYSWTINSSKANVTSTLTFGRTTGGDATINWDGSKLYTSKPLKVNENNYGDPSTSPNKIILWQSADYNYFGFGISSSTLDYFSQSIHRWHTQYTGTPGVVAMTLNSAGSLSLLGNLTINSSKADVTSSLVFGRTTGGNATLSYNGYGFNLSHPVGIGVYPNYDLEVYNAGIARIGLGRNQNAREFVIEKDTDSPYGSSIYFTYLPTGGYGFLRLMASQDTEVARFVGADQSTLLNGQLIVDLGAKSVPTVLFKRDFVTNPFSALVDTHVWGNIMPYNYSFGGINICGYSSSDSGGVALTGLIGSNSPTSTTPAVLIRGGKFNGVNSGGAVATTERVLQIDNWGSNIAHINGAGSLSLLGNLTINSSKADVTSTLTFGRTTGGDATISWDGTSLTTNKSLTINSSTTVAMKRFIRFITSNGLAGCVYAPRTSAANTDAYIGFLDAKESWAYYFRTDSSHVWKVNNIDKMYLNDTTLTTTGNLYVGGNVSAESFTDRTPFFQGDALSEIMNIKGKDGEIDHSSLPSFARKEITKRRFEDVELTTEVDAKDAYIYDTRTVEVKGVKQEEIIEDSKKLKDTVYEDEKTGKFYEKNSVGEVKIKDGKPYQSIDVGEEIEQGRDLGAMISMLTVAVQQLTNRLSDIEKWAEKFGEASRQE